MDEMLLPKCNGISGLLELAFLILPEGHEFVGYGDTDGTFYSLKQLKALEGQEIEMKKANSLKENQ